MSIVDQIRLSYPLPIAKLYESMYLESEPRQRVRKLVDLYEGTSRYLVLCGLARYIDDELSHPKVEEARSDLARATLGSWVRLLKAVDTALIDSELASLLPDPKRIYKDDAIAHATRVLIDLTAERPQKIRRLKLIHFLDSVVQFRNKKIGHGHLSIPEAQTVVGPLESGISQWLSELSALQEQLLVHIERVEWRDPQFVCYGTNLNSGASFIPLKVLRDDPVTHDHAYLFHSESDRLIPLYPFFIFDTHRRVLYAYDEFSQAQGLVLRCPYESSNAEPAHYVSYDKSIITGGESEIKGSAGGDDTIMEPGAVVSEFARTVRLIRANMSESWLTDSQTEVWRQLNKYKGPPYYVVNIYGAAGVGKTFLGWLLAKQGVGVYGGGDTPAWESWRGQRLIVLDGYDSSRRAVRSLRSELQSWDIGQAIVLTRQRAQDDIPCLHLGVTEQDIQIAKATLYRELEVIVPEGDHRNLWDCLMELEERDD